MAKELKQAIVEEWVKLVSGIFQTKDIWAELGIATPQNKTYLRVILNRMEAQGTIVKLDRNGLYRKRDGDLIPMDWQSADTEHTVPLVLPFDIHKYAKIYPKSIIIVAGEKNSGKTSLLYEIIKLNMNKFTIDLFNSETGREQMKERFAPLDIPKPAPFNTYERYDTFSDVVHPEHLSVIDYLDLNSEVYLVGTEIDAIFRKLTTGIAIIGLQKPPATVIYGKNGEKKSYSRDLAYGGAFTAKRAVLYISLGQNICKLVYVKTPAQKTLNPDNMMWSYSFDNNGYFTNIQRYYGENQASQR